ncbi:MAG: LysM peptidoglycan-binding domain-containing protein [Pedobacter sp.]|nr:MAG: LysM peptidoglycan-binding domain-containing protein [Pedobacter sp.]
MHKIYKLLLTGLLLNISASYANHNVDSIGVENNKGKKLIVHKVEAKETYYSIAKKYSVNYKDIMNFNDSKLLQIGIIVKVPTEVSFAATTNTSATTSDNTNTFDYTIVAKDNLNMLAEKYGTTVDEIKRINGLRSINLQIGQVLKIPASSNVASPVIENKTVITTPATKPVENNVVNNTTVATIEHSIKAKENLNLLAEKYGTTVEEIKRLNSLTSNNLRIGQILKIPNANGVVTETIPEKVVEAAVVKTNPKPITQQPTNQQPTNPQPTAPQQVAVTGNTNGFVHTVVTGETIYAIAKKYGLTTYQLKIANNLTADEVTVGQKLMIKDAKPAAEGGDDEDPTTNANTIKDPSLRYPASKYGITQIEQKGIAVWIADQDLDPNKMLVLHRTAIVGTIIKVTNPMTNRSAFAKVVGKFTENETTKDVIIVMTKAVADAVGALDKRFNCNINYGAQENEQQ